MTSIETGQQASQSDTSNDTCLADLPLQDIGELLHEAFETHSDAINAMCKAVVSHHCGDCREEPDGCGHQRFGNAWGDNRECGGAHVGQPAKGMQAMEAVWVEGTLDVALQDTTMGRSSYRMKARSVSKYKK